MLRLSVKKIIYFPSWLNRQNLLVTGMLLLTISPVLSLMGFIGAALVTVFGGEPFPLTRERKVVLLLLFTLSFGIGLHNHLPEAFGPGRVAFTDYVPPLWFFFCLSLKPFSSKETKKILYSFLLTIPQQFLLVIGEKMFHWRGRYFFPHRKVPLLDLYWGPSEVGLNVSGSFFNPNIFALYALMGVIFSLTLIFYTKEVETSKTQTPPFFLLAVFLMSAVMLFWTGSRYAWFALIGVLFLWGWLKSHRLLQLGAAGMVLITFLAILNHFLPLPGIQKMLPSVLTKKLTVFSIDRQLYYTWAWELIRERPIWGWGIGTFTQLVDGKIWYKVLHAHSLPLQLAVDMGLPLAVMYLSFLIGVMVLTLVSLIRRNNIKHPDDHFDRGLLMAAILIFGMQLFDLALLMTYRLNFLFWLMLAIPYGNAIDAKNNKTS